MERTTKEETKIPLFGSNIWISMHGRTNVQITQSFCHGRLHKCKQVISLQLILY